MGQNLGRCRVDGLGWDELNLLRQDLLLPESWLLNLEVGLLELGLLELDWLELGLLKLGLLKGQALLLLLKTWCLGSCSWQRGRFEWLGDSRGLAGGRLGLSGLLGVSEDDRDEQSHEDGGSHDEQR